METKCPTLSLDKRFSSKLKREKGSTQLFKDHRHNLTFSTGRSTNLKKKGRSQLNSFLRRWNIRHQSQKRTIICKLRKNLSSLQQDGRNGISVKRTCQGRVEVSEIILMRMPLVWIRLCSQASRRGMRGITTLLNSMMLIEALQVPFQDWGPIIDLICGRIEKRWKISKA